jgi:HSP20 family molecular chaperone IbpA
MTINDEFGITSMYNDWFNDFRSWALTNNNKQGYVPSTSYRTAYYDVDGNLNIEFDIPGVKRENVSVTIEDQKLNVSYVRKDAKKVDVTYTILEAFDASTTTARVEDGVLTLVIKRLKKDQKNRITVEVK